MTDANTIDIPDTVRVQCPLKGFAATRVSACPKCPGFAGLEDRFPEGLPGGAPPFAVRYLLLCNGRPTKRPLIDSVD